MAPIKRPNSVSDAWLDVLNLMKDGQWRTKEEISKQLGWPIGYDHPRAILKDSARRNWIVLESRRTGGRLRKEYRVTAVKFIPPPKGESEYARKRRNRSSFLIRHNRQYVSMPFPG
jgi:hypothetical protein